MTDPTLVQVAVDDHLALRMTAALGIDPGVVTVTRDGDTTVCVDVPPAVWTQAAAFLRDRCGLDLFDWLSAVDQPDADPAGLDVVLHVADSHSGGDGGDGGGSDSPGSRRIRRALLRTRVTDAVGHLPSLTSVWPGVAWHERETFEMFGLEFDGFDDGSGHPLRPLLLPEGFEGNPLRKSFVLAARASKPWPGAKEPGESESGGGAPSRRKTLPPGVPDPAVWPREAGSPPPPPAPAGGAAARPARPARPPRAPREPGAAPEPRVPRDPQGGTQ